MELVAVVTVDSASSYYDAEVVLDGKCLDEQSSSSATTTVGKAVHSSCVSRTCEP